MTLRTSPALAVGLAAAGLVALTACSGTAAKTTDAPAPTASATSTAASKASSAASGASAKASSAASSAASKAASATSAAAGAAAGDSVPAAKMFPAKVGAYQGMDVGAAAGSKGWAYSDVATGKTIPVAPTDSYDSASKTITDSPKPLGKAGVCGAGSLPMCVLKVSDGSALTLTGFDSSPEELAAFATEYVKAANA